MDADFSNIFDGKYFDRLSVSFTKYCIGLKI